MVSSLSIKRMANMPEMLEPMGRPSPVYVSPAIKVLNSA